MGNAEVRNRYNDLGDFNKDLIFINLNFTISMQLQLGPSNRQHLSGDRQKPRKSRSDGWSHVLPDTDCYSAVLQK